jgi:hypothetical protein
MHTHNFLIVSPNLEPIRCGVSEYSIVLKNFLTKRFTNKVYQLALADKYIDTAIEKDNYKRIPFSTSVAKKIASFKKVVEEQNPQYIIINFVSYGYGLKGLPIWFLKIGDAIPQNCKVIFIFHELWHGNFSSEKLKNKLTGYFQSLLILKIIKKIKGASILVTTELAKRILQKKQIESIVLPVFSNIPVHKILNKTEVNASKKNINAIEMIVFGFSNFEINQQLCFQFFINQIEKYKKIIHIACIGTTPSLLNIFTRLAQQYPDNFSFTSYYHIPSNEVSHILQQADYGITTYMKTFWSKSGAIAAMLAHQLPIICFGAQKTLDDLDKGICIPNTIVGLNDIHKNYELHQNISLENVEDYNAKIFEKFEEILINNR